MEREYVLIGLPWNHSSIVDILDMEGGCGGRESISLKAVLAWLFHLLYFCLMRAFHGYFSFLYGVWYMGKLLLLSAVFDKLVLNCTTFNVHCTLVSCDPQAVIIPYIPLGLGSQLSSAPIGMF